MPIGTSFGEEALKNTRYRCTATVASRVARLLSISVADYITQFCDGVAPIKTPLGSDAESGHESLSASESNSSEDEPNVPARSRIFAKKKHYTDVRSQAHDLAEDMKKRERLRADAEALHQEMWRDIQLRRAPRRVAPPAAAVPRPHSSVSPMPHSQSRRGSGVDRAGETGVHGGLKATSRAGARSSARRTPPTAFWRCQTASTCAPPPSVARTMASVSPTRPSTSGTSMPSPGGSLARTMASVSPTRPATSGTSMPGPRGCGAPEVDMRITLPWVLTAFCPQTSDPDKAVTTNAATQDKQLATTEHCAEPPSP